MKLGNFYLFFNAFPKHVSMAAMENGEQFRMLNHHGKPEGGRFTVVENSNGVFTALDHKGKLVDLSENKYKLVKPIDVIPLTIAAKLKYYG
jgi:hypothetical protein